MSRLLLSISERMSFKSIYNFTIRVEYPPSLAGTSIGLFNDNVFIFVKTKTHLVVDIYKSYFAVPLFRYFPLVVGPRSFSSNDNRLARFGYLKFTTITIDELVDARFKLFH